MNIKIEIELSQQQAAALQATTADANAKASQAHKATRAPGDPPCVTEGEMAERLVYNLFETIAAKMVLARNAGVNAAFKALDADGKAKVFDAMQREIEGINGG